ncbi:MAG: EF-P lysine aminoacylase GenX [Gammaproteobacteria bacterium]|nr:EF-P lysine aminoacylase GenX [Gammaproteobacteria bacterium]
MSWRPSATVQMIRARAKLYQQIRTYFSDSGCLEVDTPLLSSATNTDPDIASIYVQNQYLQTSPEFAMKRLLAADSGSIYQICHAFRESEQGRQHRPEFTLLEWYRLGFDYQQLMDEMEQLIDLVSGQQNQFRRLSYQALFAEFLAIDIYSINLVDLQDCCQQHVPGTDVVKMDTDQCLDLLISLVIAPGMKGYIFVYDYPLSQAALARPSQNDPKVAERFELFHDGLELANGFSELTDAGLQRSRFMADNQQREKRGLVQYTLDENLLSALEAGLPGCAGVALGLDRLLMVLLKLDSIDQVMSFCDV